MKIELPTRKKKKQACCLWLSQENLAKVEAMGNQGYESKSAAVEAILNAFFKDNPVTTLTTGRTLLPEKEDNK